MQTDKVICKKQEEIFEGLTLLSSYEYDKYKNNIPKLNKHWWLRSSGSFSSFSAYAVRYSTRYLDFVSRDCNVVRPALRLNHESSNLKIGDKFKFYNHDWTVISNKYALCDEEFCRMAFRKDWEAMYDNDYELSDVKRYLDCEWKKMKDGDSDSGRRRG